MVLEPWTLIASDAIELAMTSQPCRIIDAEPETFTARDADGAKASTQAAAAVW